LSYLALARKWRPKFFSDVAGQDHVVRALLNGLKMDRVHHAFLFAGTRGVGKTTIARILAKALNCEADVSGEPCGECSACVSIDEGRFVDLLEVDAASRTKVEQTRELLENVQYTPTVGRCKIYLIDEVHMLSASSFNALLKTLEEPPPHVKFLLATTDPQKLPVTVLSRCLQFNLKSLPTALICDRMQYICEQEEIEAEGAALTRVARAAAGSMRDGLSLLDQAVAYAGGALTDSVVAEMLGSMDARHLREIFQALVAGDGAGLIALVRQLQEQVPDYASVLEDFATLLQQIAVVQLAGVESLGEDADTELVQEFAAQLDADMVQLYYQLAVTGRRDIGLAPDQRIGFEMTLLRMLAFQPAETGGAAPSSSPKIGNGKPSAAPASPQRAKGTSTAKAAPEIRGVAVNGLADTGDWAAMVAATRLRGAALQLARSCELVSCDADGVQLSLARSSQYLMSDGLQAQLTEAIRQQLGQNVSVRYALVDGDVDSEVERGKIKAEEKQDEARQAIAADPNVRELQDIFDATLVEDSVKPVQRSDQPN
jgi:DNA polymerase-3 subunit gamma/tau